MRLNLVQEAPVPTRQDVSKHYTHGNLIAAIRGGIESLGKTINSVRPLQTLSAIAGFCQ
jgi:hypothetical protein